MKGGVRQVGAAYYVKYVDASGRPREHKVAARTMAEARSIRAELVLREDRIRLGLESSPVTCTFAEAAEKYLTYLRQKVQAREAARRGQRP